MQYNNVLTGNRSWLFLWNYNCIINFGSQEEYRYAILILLVFHVYVAVLLV